MTTRARKRAGSTVARRWWSDWLAAGSANGQTD